MNSPIKSNASFRRHNGKHRKKHKSVRKLNVRLNSGAKKKNLKQCSVSVKNPSLWLLMSLLMLLQPEHGTANQSD